MKLVLFAEDEADVAAPWGQLLQRYFDVDIVQSLDQCFHYLKTTKPDCILLDLNLSDSKGLATLDRLIALRPEIAVVVFTGSIDMAQQSIHKGAQDYIVKDGQYTPQRMADIIGKAIDRHEVRQDLKPLKTKILKIQEKLEVLSHTRPPDLQDLPNPSKVLDSDDPLGQAKLLRDSSKIITPDPNKPLEPN